MMGGIKDECEDDGDGKNVNVRMSCHQIIGLFLKNIVSFIGLFCKRDL